MTHKCDLFFIVHPEELVRSFSPSPNNTWHLSRKPQKFKHLHILLCCQTGWVVHDQVEGREAVVIMVPARSSTDHQDLNRPPLGQWVSSDGRKNFTLTDKMPIPPRPESPIIMERRFASLHCVINGDVVHMKVALHNVPLDDAMLDDALSQYLGLLQLFGRDPHMVVLQQFTLQNAPVPAMRHVRQLMSFTRQNSSTFDLVVRGNVYILKSNGIWGGMMLSIIRFCQRLMAARVPEKLVGTQEEAQDFVQQLADSVMPRHMPSVPKVLESKDPVSPATREPVSSSPGRSPATTVGSELTETFGQKIVENHSVCKEENVVPPPDVPVRNNPYCSPWEPLIDHLAECETNASKSSARYRAIPKPDDLYDEKTVQPSNGWGSCTCYVCAI